MGKMDKYLVNSIIDERSGIPEAETQISSSLLLSCLPQFPPGSTSSVLVSTAGNSNVGLETVISTVFWKHHSCLETAIVPKMAWIQDWFYDIPVSYYPLELWERGTDETSSWN